MLIKWQFLMIFVTLKCYYKGGEKIYPYIIVCIKIFCASKFSYLKIWFKICNFENISWLFIIKFFVWSQKKKKKKIIIILYSNPFHINSQIGYYLLTKKSSRMVIFSSHCDNILGLQKSSKTAIFNGLQKKEAVINTTEYFFPLNLEGCL